MTRAIALALTVATGFSGLVYEIAWQKYLAILLGSHSEATASVLAIFLGGLSLGYALFGRATRVLVRRSESSGNPLRLLRFYALIEGSIGVYAALFPLLFGAAQALSLLVPGGHAGFAFAFDLTLSALLIGPPAVLMGGTIPILTLALTRSLGEATRIHALVYGLNTAGAFVGAWTAGFFLIPILGLDAVLYSMGALNLTAAAGFAYLDHRERHSARKERSEVTTSATSDQAADKPKGYVSLLAVATLAGFAMMALQTTLIRVGGLSLGSSMFTFAMIVAAFVLAIAVGSFTVSAFTRISASAIVGSQWLLVALLVILYRQIPNGPYYTHTIRVFFRETNESFYPYQLFMFISVLAILIVPIALSGALLPLLFHHLRRTVGELGSLAGGLYSWNTVGSLLGALLGGYVLLMWIDLHLVYRIALAALVVGAGILTVQLLHVRAHWVVLLVVLPMLGGLSTLEAWDPERLTSGLFRTRAPRANSYVGADEFFETRRRGRIIFHRDGPSTTTTVREDGEAFGPPDAKGRENEKPRRSIATNGKPDGHLIGDYPTMALAALIPGLLAEKAERSFVIGFGTGVTAGELAALDSMREVYVAEIAQSVLDAAPYFEAGNMQPLASPKVVLHRGDAYRTLLRSAGTYDMIVSEPSNPWVTGVEMLYSVEFLEAARDRLSAGGVYAQWFHQYEASDDAVELVLRTYASVFPHVAIWFAIGPDLLIMGFNQPERALDIDAMKARFRQADFRAGFERVGIKRFPAVLAHELAPLGVVHSADLPGELHTLRHPRLSYLAARGFYTGERAWLPSFLRPASVKIGRQNSLLRRLAQGGPLPEQILGPAARETCRLKRHEICATLMALWQRRFPDSKRRESALEQARKNRGRSGKLSESSLDDLMRFFDPNTTFERSPQPLISVRRQTVKYLEHFHYPTPFARRALRNLWRECDTTPCEAVLQKLEEIAGPLEPTDRPQREPAPRRRRFRAPDELTTIPDAAHGTLHE